MNVRLVTRAELKKVFGLPYSTTHIYRMMNAGEFPLAVHLSEHRVAWVSEEIEAWIAERIETREQRKRSKF